MTEYAYHRSSILQVNLFPFLFCKSDFLHFSWRLSCRFIRQIHLFSTTIKHHLFFSLPDLILCMLHIVHRYSKSTFVTFFLARMAVMYFSLPSTCIFQTTKQWECLALHFPLCTSSLYNAHQSCITACAIVSPINWTSKTTYIFKKWTATGCSSLHRQHSRDEPTTPNLEY